MGGGDGHAKNLPYSLKGSCAGALLAGGGKPRGYQAWETPMGR